MKKWIPITILLILSANFLFAQSGGERPVRQRLKAQRVAFITERIDLTPSEAEKFWPMYNQFENDKKDIQKKYTHNKRLVNMSDEELEKQLLDGFTRDQELLELKKSYFSKFKKIISVRKIAMLQVAEKEFRKSIVDKLKENRGNRPNQNRQNK